MTRRLKWIIIVGGVLVVAAYAARRRYFPHHLEVARSSAAPLPDTALRERIHLPPGFSIGTFVSGIDNARFLRFTAAGDLLVSAPAQGTVFLVERDADGDGRADGQHVLLDHLNLPHGLALRGGWLYVAETDAVLRVRFDPTGRQISGTPERIIRGLPAGGMHWTRTIGVGPDGWLYLSMGSDCNACTEKDPRRAAFTRYHVDGSGEETYATGLRNSVGFAWQPGTDVLYATENGRDWLGDDFPPDELNRIVQGGFYGWPFANGNRVPDPDNGKGQEERVAASSPPAHAFGAHVAPLGMTFYTGTMFPERYRGAAFVAQHGSWNRSKKSGYKVVAVFFGADGAIREEEFAGGFMIDEKVSGRPVDVAVGPDGALYVSDDYTGSIYRVAYHAP
jgi:glucose/arabinose dehydrogenase